MNPSDITPIGPAGVSDAQLDTTTSQAVAPAAPSSADLTIGDGFRNQQESVEKAAPNVAALASGPAADPECGTTGSPEPPLGQADLTALRLKSAAQILPEAGAASVPGAPLTKDVAAPKPQLLSLATPYDVAADPSTQDSGNPQADPAAPADPAAAAATDSTDSTSSVFDDLFSEFLQPIFLMNLGFVLAGYFVLNGLDLGIFGLDKRNGPSGDQDQDPSDRANNNDSPESAVVRRWIQMLMVGGELKEVITEQVRVAMRDVTNSNLVRVVHVFTPFDVTHTMQKLGIMPVDMPRQDLVAEKVGQAAQSALSQLTQALRTNHLN